MKTLSDKNIDIYKEKNLELYSQNLTQFNSYFYIPQSCFSSIEPFIDIFWDIDPLLKSNESTIKTICSLLAEAAWDYYTGMSAYNTVVGYIVSCTIETIINALVGTFDGLRNTYYTAKNTCSEYPYPQSSWALVFEITWDVTYVIPQIISTNWQFEGSNDPYIN